MAKEFIYDEDLFRELVDQLEIDNERDTRKKPNLWKEFIDHYNMSIVDGEKIPSDFDWFQISKKWSNMKQRDKGNK